MKKNFLRKTLRNLSFPVVVMLLGGCGVEAGNPDSKGGKLSRIFVSPTSYPDVGSVSLSIERVNLVQGDAVFSRNYQSQKLDLMSKNGSASEDSAPALSVELAETQNKFERIELILAKEDPYLQVSLNSKAEPVKAAVVSEMGVVSRSLVFNGTTNSNANIDVVVDVELRKSLRPITAEQREQLNLPNDVVFVIQQKHSFLEFAEAGAIGFSDFEASSLVCVFVGESLPAASADACTGAGFKSQIVSSRGTATIGSLVSGEYRVVNITRDNRVVELGRTTVSSGSKVVLSGK
jgi:hypothetical protein